MRSVRTSSSICSSRVVELGRGSPADAGCVAAVRPFLGAVEPPSLCLVRRGLAAWEGTPRSRNRPRREAARQARYAAASHSASRAARAASDAVAAGGGIPRALVSLLEGAGEQGVVGSPGSVKIYMEPTPFVVGSLVCL